MVDIRNIDGSWHKEDFADDFSFDSTQEQSYSKTISDALINLEKERRLRVSLERVLEGIKTGEIRTGHITRSVPDKEAEIEIIKFIETKKTEGIKDISIIDIILALNLPASQINITMEKLKMRGVKEAE